MSQRIIPKPQSLTFKVGKNVLVTSVRTVTDKTVLWRMHSTQADTVELKQLPDEDLTVTYTLAEAVLVAAAWPFPK